MNALDLELALPLPWQDALWARLQGQREAGQLPHALLLAGPAGVGKRRFATALGAGLLCLTPVNGVACRNCRACALLAAGTHPDWNWLAPEEKGKAIKIDVVRDLVNAMAQTAQQGGRKLAVLEPAEAMNRNAANALLKTLEEPSGAAVLLLISDSPARLLPTIRSRCQRLDFPLPPMAQTRAWLTPLAGSEARLEQALTESGQRPLLARALLEADGLEKRQALDTELGRFLAGELSPLALAERWQEVDFDDLLDWLKLQVGAALRARSARTPTSDAAHRLAQLDPPRLFAWFDQVQAVHNHSRAGGNPNRQLALEALFITLAGYRAN